MVGLVLAEVAAAAHDPATQWLVAVCLASYLVTFAVLQARFSEERWAWISVESWLVLGLGWSVVRYALDYRGAPTGTEFLVLLTGAVLGRGAVAWVAWGRTSGLAVERRTRCRALALLTLLLLAGACWQPQKQVSFQYRDQVRWSGPWDNPNLFGLLMGTGLVLAVGMAASLCFGVCSL
jgi:hypothetical protein